MKGKIRLKSLLIFNKLKMSKKLVNLSVKRLLKFDVIKILKDISIRQQKKQKNFTIAQLMK